MKPLAYISFILASGTLMAASCTKGSPNITGGGKGGTATIVVTPEHHGEFVDSCKVYIKYGTNDAPANGVYDDSIACVLADTTPVAVFTGLTTGLYYVYGQGYHSTYTPPYIKGGVPVTVQVQDTNVVYLPTYSYQP